MRDRREVENAVRHAVRAAILRSNVMLPLDACPLCEDKVAPRQVRANRDVVGCRCGYIVVPLSDWLTLVPARQDKNLEDVVSAAPHKFLEVNKNIAPGAPTDEQGRIVRLSRRM